jgi:hypothetical protein
VLHSTKNINIEVGRLIILLLLYVVETRTVALREEHSLRVFECKELRTGGLRMLHNEVKVKVKLRLCFN